MNLRDAQLTVQTDIREVLTFSSDDVGSVYTAIDTADHHDFSVDPGFLIHRIKSAFERDVGRKPISAEVREVVELFRTRFEGDFGAGIDQLLSEEANAKDQKIESDLGNDPLNGQVDTAGDLPSQFSINPVFIAHVESAVKIYTIVSRIFDEVHSQLQRNPTAKEVFAILGQIEIGGHFPLRVKVSLQDKPLVLKKITLGLDRLIREFDDSERVSSDHIDSGEEDDSENGVNGDGHKSSGHSSFYFDVDPDVDLAIGTELAMDEAEGEFELEDFQALGIDPLSPTGAKPGSEEKVRVLTARYAAGVMDLWHPLDCYDHNPQGSDEVQEFDIVNPQGV